jgi:2-dehydro-3-deoxygalactonokinase
LRQALKALIAALIDQTRESPSRVLGAVMITSSLGLMEIPHLAAPAGVSELVVALRRCEFQDITDLPIFLVPGVRCGPAACTVETIGRCDMMRGEETLCVGLAALGLIPSPAVVMNLGSHWKAIQIDTEGRITGSTTSLAGEMIHAIQTTTILAGSLPKERPPALEMESVKAGMRELRAHGLARALFCVRLLEQLIGESSPVRRMSFLTGAFIASELDALMDNVVLTSAVPIALVGHPAMTGAWRSAIEDAGLIANVISEISAEKAFLRGLTEIVSRASV